MLNVKKILTIINLIFILVLCGCQNSKCIESSDTQSSTIEYVKIENKKFRMEEIQKGIKDTFNNVLYNYGNDDTSTYLTRNKNLFLNNELEFELYFEPNFNTEEKAFVFSPKIYLIITNVFHPLSTNEKPKLYIFGIDITKWGLRSDFSYQGYIDINNKTSFKETTDIIFLGNYNMCIDKIVEPEYETMDEEWQNNVKKSIELYMDNNNNFNKNIGDNFISGKYHIYVQGFFKSDKDSVIIFENENGNIYMGYYYFIHEIAKDKPADINKVELVSDSDKKHLKAYLEKIHTNAAISMEYTLK